MGCKPCLVCRSVSLHDTSCRVDKLEALILLQIVFDVPEGSNLVKTLTDKSSKSISICDQCYCLFKQCKEIYGELCKAVERFWQVKNKLVREALSSEEST